MLRLSALLLIVAALAAHSSAWAQESADTRRYSKYYNGSFVDLSARAGYQHVTSASYRGLSWDVGLRQALVMHLLDTRLAFREEHYSPRSGSGGGTLVVRAVDVSTAFHPLYMALLFSDRIGYLIASWYIEAGVGGQYATLPNVGDDWGFRFHIGSGLDVPITDPDRGWSIWLNTLYRFTWADFDFDAGGEFNLYHHALFAGLSLRFNGLLF